MSLLVVVGYEPDGSPVLSDRQFELRVSRGVWVEGASATALAKGGVARKQCYL